MRNRPRLLDLDPGLGTDNGLGRSRTRAGMVGWRAKSLLWTRLLQIEVSQEEGSSPSLPGSVLAGPWPSSLILLLGSMRRLSK